MEKEKQEIMELISGINKQMKELDHLFDKGFDSINKRLDSKESKMKEERQILENILRKL
ncbi:hypothetical protein AA0X95_00970 [Bacillus sp. 1P10SD]|uniref:hypothetical protein n=1 Tax=Bacillus sp. 1P10SD TaxID=3132265 RepID=UPI0039A715C7